ncbi:hypothetical protein GN244_ATG19198, partial [Phytophthora infestans]
MTLWENGTKPSVMNESKTLAITKTFSTFWMLTKTGYDEHETMLNGVGIMGAIHMGIAKDGMDGETGQDTYHLDGREVPVPLLQVAAVRTMARATTVDAGMVEVGVTQARTAAVALEVSRLDSVVDVDDASGMANSRDVNAIGTGEEGS